MNLVRAMREEAQNYDFAALARLQKDLQNSVMPLRPEQKTALQIIQAELEHRRKHALE